MHHHVDYRGYKAVLKKQLSNAFRIYLSVSIFLLPLLFINQAYAQPPGWVKDYINTEKYNQQLKEKAKVTSSNGNITSSVSASGTSSAGTAVKTTAVLTKKASSGSVAAQIAKRYGKAIGVSAAGAFLGSAALQLLIEGIGWAMGDGGKIIKKETASNTCNSDGSNCTYSQYIYTVSSYSGTQTTVGTSYSHTSATTLCSSLNRTTNNDSTTYSTSTFIQDSGNRQFYCLATMKAGNQSYVLSFDRSPNENYDASSTIPTSNSPVTTTELQEAVKSYIDSNPSSQIANDLNVAAYSHDAANDDSSSLASENANAMQSSLNNAASSATGTASNTSTDKAGNPQNVTSTVKSGAEATGEATTTNPDGSQSGSSMSMQFPAFCDWASVVCDFIDWVKDDSQLPEEEPPEVKEIELPKLNTNTFRGTPGCPQPIVVPVTIGTQGTTEISYEPICQFASKWSFVAPLIGFLSGALIVIGVGRKGEDSEI